MGSIIQMRPRNAVTGDLQSEFDNATGETITRISAVILDEDFIGPSHAASAGIPTSATVGYPWIQKTVKTGGSPSVAAISNASGGVVRMSLDATSEKQEASLYAADVLNWDLTKSTVFECRIAMHVIPTGVVEMVWGMQSAWIDGPDNASFYCEFQASASGVVNLRTKDGVNTVSNACNPATTLVADAMHIFRIDVTDPTNVQFYIDGSKVSPVPPTALMAFAATGANAILQPYFTVYKASGVGVGTMDIDMVQLGMNRS